MLASHTLCHANSAVSQCGAPRAFSSLDCSPLLMQTFLGVKDMPGPEFLEVWAGQ